MIAHALANVRLRLSTASKGLLKVFGYAWSCQCLSHTSINKCNILCQFLPNNFFMADKNKQPQSRKPQPVSEILTNLVQSQGLKDFVDFVEKDRVSPGYDSLKKLNAMADKNKKRVGEGTVLKAPQPMPADYFETLVKKSLPNPREYKGVRQTIPAKLVMADYKFNRFPYTDIIARAAEEYNINPYILAGLVMQESKFDPKAGSGAGARGLAQIVPSTFAEAFPRKKFRGQKPDIFNPEHSIYTSAAYLNSLLNNKKWAFDDIAALRAYNQGPGNQLEYPAGGKEARPYPYEVIRRAMMFGAEPEYVTLVGTEGVQYPAQYANRAFKEYSLGENTGIINRLDRTGELLNEYAKFISPQNRGDVDVLSMLQQAAQIKAKNAADAAAKEAAKKAQQKAQKSQRKK